MTAVSPLRKDLQVEELRTGSAASESTMQRIASSVNFWNKYYEGSKGWFMNGPYSSIAFPQVGVDGGFFVNSNMEIYQIGAYNLVAGSSGEVEFDIIRHPVGGGPSVSIFTTKPKISYLAGNEGRFLKDMLLSTAIYASISGITLPVVSGVNLDAGDFLTCNLVSGQVDAESCGIILSLRPR